MQESAISRFIQAVNQSPDLRENVRQVLEGSEDPSGFVALGRKNGYEFSEADARSYFKEALAPPKERGELGEKDLESVSGGKPPASPAAGAKPPASNLNPQLGQVINLFRGLNFTSPPTWTGFGF